MQSCASNSPWAFLLPEGEIACHELLGYGDPVDG